MNREPSQVEALFKAALDVAPGDRSAFLRKVCGPDDALRLELEARLQQTVDDLEETRTAHSGLPTQATEWGGLRLITPIGMGGFGQVFRARDQTLARDVALKIIALQTHEDAAAVLREGQMLARVRHRNVVTVYSAQRVGDEVGVTMELIEGQNLADIIHVSGPMGAEEAAVIGVSLTQALAAVHAAGLAHRDIKARNVMRERGGRIVLMDFGLGLDLETSDAAATVSGTPPYIAPELFSGAPATPASDLYSLGVLLFFLVTGAYPVTGTTVAAIVQAHRRGDRRHLSDVRPDLPREFVAVVERALSAEPATRYRSAGAMMQALIEAIPDTRARPARRVARWIAGGVIVIVGCLLLGLVTSTAFNATVRRTGGFSDDTPLDWLILGAQSLFAPFIYAVLTIVALAMVRTVWRVLRRSTLAPRVAGATRSSGAWSAIEPAMAAQWLLIVQAVAFGLIVWQFFEVFSVLAYFPDGIDPSSVALLSEASFTPQNYRQSLTVTLVMTLLAWLALLRVPATAGAIDQATRGGGLAMLVATVLLLQLPYRLMFQNEQLVVEHDGLRCYELGRRERDVLIYCPRWDPPRIRIRAGDSVISTNVREHLFTPPPPR